MRMTVSGKPKLMPGGGWRALWRVVSLALVVPVSALAQEPLALDERCTITVGNQTALVRPDGGYRIRNISVFQSRDTGVAPQLYRARATCLRGGQMITGQSEFFSLVPEQTTIVAEILPSDLDPIPVGITGSAAVDVVPLGATVQLTVLATLPDGGVEDVTPRSAGTTYLSTNPRLLAVSDDGLVTGVNSTTSPQTGTIAVLNEGNLTTIDFNAVGPSNDFDNDGMPNDYEDLFGLDKLVDDADGDLDGDGLTNLEEFNAGTLPNNPDTDGDGVLDGLDGNPLHPEEAPPAVTITPADGDMLLEGQTVTLRVDAMDDGLLTNVELSINGLSFGSSNTSPLEVLFTVPLTGAPLDLAASATDSVGNVGSATATVPVVADPLTTVEGEVVDTDGIVVEGADVALKLSGLQGEFFDFDVTLTAFPDLKGLTPDVIRPISAVNLINPDGSFSTDTFGVGFTPDFAARFSGLIRIPAPGIYEFTLGVDDGARLTIDGSLVVEVVAAAEFTEGSGMIDLPAGALPIEIEYFQSLGDAELQLSSSGPGGATAAIVSPTDLAQSPDLFATTSDASGQFSVPGVQASLGDIRAEATALVEGNEVTGSSEPTPPVPGGITDLGQITVGLNVLYGAAFIGPNGPATLYGIDPENGVATEIGPIGFWRVSAMDFSPSGVLYATGRDPATGLHVLLTIDTDTGAGTQIGPTGVETLGFGQTVSDVSFRPSDGTLFAYLEDRDGLGTIDLDTGAATALGSTFISCCGNGMAFSSDGTLLHANENNLHVLDQTTGQASVQAPLDFPPVGPFLRINSMDFQPETGILFGFLIGDTGGQPIYLVTVEPASGVVSLVGGQTVNGLDAIAWGPR